MIAAPLAPFPPPNLVSLGDLSPAELKLVRDTALEIKANQGAYNDLLRGKRLAMVFEKESLRTRFTFDIGMQDLGGSATFLDLSNGARMGARESVRDMAKTLERWTHAIVARTYRHRTVVELAQTADVPVVNGLSELLHPCQALADFLTMQEAFGDLRGQTLAYVGDGNNVAHALMLCGALLGVNVRIGCPEGFEPLPGVVDQARSLAVHGAQVSVITDPVEAVRGAQALYTDVWASMGQEQEQAEREQAFQGFCLDEDLLAEADSRAIVLHCLPAHRGEEISAGVME